MSIYERVSTLAKQKGYRNLSELSKAVGLGTNAIYDWKKHAPSLNNVIAVAKKLDVNVDYLIGNDSPNSRPINIAELSVTEQTSYVNAFGKPINDDDWQVILTLLSRYSDK